MTAGQAIGNSLISNVFDVTLATGESPHFGRIDVQADDGDARTRKLNRQRQPHVTKTDNRDSHMDRLSSLIDREKNKIDSLARRQPLPDGRGSDRSGERWRVT